MVNYECKVESKSPIRRELTISVKPDSIQEYIDQQFAELQKTAKVKGFRQGKVPLQILKRYYLQDVKTDVFSKVVRESYVKALEENKLFAVGMPQIETKSGADLKEGEPLTFTASIEVFPEIKVGDLSKVEVTRPSTEVTDEDVDKNIQNLRENHAEMVPDEEYAGPAKDGDFAQITFSGTLDGEALDSLKGENRLIHIGAKHYMEEFESNLIGLKKGDDKSFTVAFPQDFSDPKLAGKTVQFNVTVHEFKKKQLPELDDEFAKRFKLESRLELRKKVFESMKEERAQNSREKVKEDVLNALIKQNAFEVPQGVVQSQIEYLMRENASYLKQNGFTEKMIRDYFEKNLESLRSRAEDQVRASLVLDRIADEQDLKPEEKDLELEYQKMAERVNLKPEQVKELYERDENAMRQLRFRIKEDRAIEYLLSQVKIRDAK
ncbi:MAG: trigger factor [Bdellovibrionota bacterium]